MSFSFLLAQSVSGLTAAMFLFIVASGLSLIFGVLRVLNFAHGRFYMLGAYVAWQITQWLGRVHGQLLARGARLGACRGAARRRDRAAAAAPSLRPRRPLPAAVHLRAGADPRRRGARALGHAAALRAAATGFSGSFEMFGTVIPHYNLFIIVLGPAIAIACWLLLSRTGTGRMIRAAAYDREMLAALGADVGKLYTLMFMAGSFLAGLGGALVTPVRSIVPGMDVDIIVEAFIVVVIGGLGSFWGTFLGALIFGQVLAFGILILPGFSIFAVFALMALVLVVRPSGLLGRPVKG